jgi:hypothetical protein
LPDRVDMVLLLHRNSEIPQLTEPRPGALSDEAVQRAGRIRHST